MSEQPQATLCSQCYNLEVWPKLFGGIRYLCFKRVRTMKTWGKYGRDTSKGYPIVQKCKEFESGCNYSVKSRKIQRS